MNRLNHFTKEKAVTMCHSRTAIALFLVVFSSLLYGQTIAPGLLNQNAKDTCPPSAPYDWKFPLLHRNSDDVECFYTHNGWIDPIKQVRFLYGLGEDAKTLSADLTSMVFPFGLQTALGTSVTSGPTNVSTTGQTQDSPSLAFDKLQAGGDFYVRGSYPLLFKDTENFTGTIFFIPKLGFNFNGFGSQTTITEATEYNINTSFEGYGQYRAIGNVGDFYGDARIGYQYVQPDFAKAVGLTTHNFMMTQIAAGIQFDNFLRIGFQRYFGPAPAFNLSQQQLYHWHLVLEIAPLAKKKDH
jgi:hypothetical protein